MSTIGTAYVTVKRLPSHCRRAFQRLHSSYTFLVVNVALTSISFLSKMDIAAPEGVPVQRFIPSYNISLNLSSVFGFLPGSRFFARLRRGMPQVVDVASSPSSSMELWVTETLDYASNSNSIQEVTPAPAPGMEQLPTFPGPWGFFTSQYMIGLFFMAVLLHRIQNLVIPSRQPSPSPRQRHAFRFAPAYASSRGSTIFRRIYASILPLDLSRTSTRLMLHLPSAYLLSKMFFIWFLLILHTSEILPPYQAGETTGWWAGLPFLQRMVHWSSEKEMSAICWSTFCAVCVAFLVEGLVKALDGMGSGFPIGNSNPNTSPFNLVGYAFLLHVYSSPITHAYQPLDKSPSRPDKHVIITIAIPLLQLTIFHLLSISRRLSMHRLIPTAVTSLLSLVHFHGTLFSHFRKSTLSAPIPISTTNPGAVSPHVSPHVSYPLLNYIPNIFETFLISTILLTVFLNTLAQLLVRGRVDRVFSGLGIGQGTVLQDEDDAAPPGFFRSLPLDEDFGVLLLRVGIASLEATGLRGWGNEMAPIQLPPGSPRRRRRRHTSTAHGISETYGVVRMGRAGVGEVYPGSAPSPVAGSSSGIRARRPVHDDVFSDVPSSRRRRAAAAPQYQRRGLDNEVRTVDLGNGHGGRATDAHGAPDASGWLGSAHWWRWLRVFAMFLGSVWGVVRGLVGLLLDRARGRSRLVVDEHDAVQTQKVTRRSAAERRAALKAAARPGESADESDETKEERRVRMESETYARFVRGEDISDDEEDTEVIWPSSDDGSDNESEEEREEEQEREAEAVTLFSDLLRHGAGGRDASPTASPTGHRGLHDSSNAGNGEMVLAHLLHGTSGPSPGPLTRRRWNALVRQDDSGLFLDDDEKEEEEGLSAGKMLGDSHENDGASERGLHTCVICTSEGRDIICWPCRCLAMCDGCREALASKSAPTKHRCPCCRQPVEGYSRIYIP